MILCKAEGSLWTYGAVPAIIGVIVAALLAWLVVYHRSRKDNSMTGDPRTRYTSDAIPQRSGILQNQEFPSIPQTLTPQNMALPQMVPSSLEEVHRTTEALLVAGGFNPTKPYPPRMFVGPFGEILRVAFVGEDGLRIDYADDYTLALEERFQIFGSYPKSLGDRMLSVIYDDLLDYTEGMLELL